MLDITKHIILGKDELVERHIRASGPGGQHVNKSSTAIQLQFDAANSPNLPGHILPRLRQIAGSRMSEGGLITITADSHRSQELNRQDARSRLAAMIRQALIPPKKRRPTKPTRASKTRRMDSKTKRGTLKKARSNKNWD